MSTVITKGGRGVRSTLAYHDFFSGVKKTFTRRFHKAVRRDAKNIIQEQLQETAVSKQEQHILDLRDQDLREELDFWGWDSQEQHDWEMERLYDRQTEQLQDLLDWETRHIHGLS